MYLTVCPLHDPDRDSSMGEWMNVRISLSVLSVAWVIYSSVGEWMNLTVCLPCHPGIDIAQWENEWISQSVFPVAPGHDSSVGEGIHLTVCPPHGQGSFPDYGGVFQEDFPWLISSCQPVLSQCGRKCEHWGGRLTSNHGQTMAERKSLVDGGVMKFARGLIAGLLRVCANCVFTPLSHDSYLHSQPYTGV